ncbi:MULTISPECIES: cytochrome o ubiquinol oxidase subunit IV [Brevibacillus]|jgi:cytochrome o ubiquinol oxidase operon protein cyoD|uniref:Cytochrome o ubiquinol oxidase subunit IV n=1 Tax=Brevibacillus parabrevis TaxID=54914 RepID=A0A4Y3PH05_BREPA|nr:MULTISPECIES: cytochrome o ubiquinol oxidase subunit IV [Brevibacillus]TGV30216.1 cytochrome o ubiquinol oxidase subunit IV [Mesorhizobium sp. M00.F.Ca.ET.186.01.1.1]KZE51713.1 cytochrome o ubiquinol oxidase subunit IV [Brevibacillus parabrevis]MBU8712622.1 cytochrome o ubiquinol oxidase subunit IV [Brevibacillus parabrevis]MDH6348121.1 cytochrome o ubiquinol oxidase operon protein cyoD [Brevibacillus sp. 1238]MDR5000246.1 cytochrome o ubiquinol oxidase subunit IV [Brevibacillus parabrevis]
MTQHQNHGGHQDHGSLKSYVIGFVLSIVLTIIPLVLVMNQMLEKTALVITILVMAILQFVVQLFFFMHIREGEKPRYNVQTLILGLVIVFTIIAGSIWIMMFNKY